MLQRVLTDRGTNIAAIQSITNMSSILPSRTSTIAAPRPRAQPPFVVIVCEKNADSEPASQ